MADSFTAEQRSEIMSRIRSTNTKPEERLHAIAREVLGKRRRIDRNASALLGAPDLYIPSLKLVVFVDGCFFHGCLAHCRIPQTNREYWVKKIERNMRRDRRVRRKLRQSGLAVWRFWEHEVKPSRWQAASQRMEMAVRRQKERLS